MSNFPKLQNRLRGRTAKAEGVRFENLFLIAARVHGVAISRIHDGCQRVAKNRLIPRKQPFDWVLSLGGLSALIDTKSTSGIAFPCSGIDPNQLRELARHAEQGAIAGYVVHARKSQEFFFIPADVLLAKSRLPRGSIGGKEPGCVHLGTAQHPNLTAIFQRHVERIVSEVREESRRLERKGEVH